MRRASLNEEIEHIGRRVARLEHPRAAAYFACCGERLLPLYRAFVRREQWGDPAVLRGALDAVWDALERAVQGEWAGLAAAVELQTPHADDFDSLETTFAQDACFSAGMAVQALSGSAEPGWVEYTLEVLRVAVCVEQTGHMDLGSGPEYEVFQRELVLDDRVQKELAFQEADLAMLESADPPDYRAMRERAAANTWTVALLLPHGEPPPPEVN